MGSAISWTVTAKGVSKPGAVALFMEFWTSKGFGGHSASYNRLVLRRNGYGTVRSWLGSNLADGETPYAQTPMELTALVQIRPELVKYEMQFTLGPGLSEQNPGSLKAFTEAEVDEFISFINDWTAHSRQELE